MANNRENVSIFWDSPVNADGTLYSHIKGYELHHNIPGYPSPLMVPSSVTSGGPVPLPPGKYHIAVSTVNTEGLKSAKVMTKFQIANPLINPNAKRGYGIPLGGIISSATTLSSGGVFNVTNTSGWAFASEGAPQVFTSYATGQTDRFEQDCSDIGSLTFSSMSENEQVIKSHYLFYDYSDANDPWKLLKWRDTVYATNNINIGYFWDTGTGDDGTDTWTEHVARAFTSKTGTVTLAAGSNEVVGSGTSFSSEYEIGDIILFSGNTQAGVVTYVDTDESLTIDRTFTTAISGSIKRQGTRIDKNYDAGVYSIRNNGGTFEKLAINLTVDTDVFTGQGVRQVNLYKLNDASLTSTTAGTFADPGDGNTDWSQAVPALVSNNDIIYVATRTFTSDAASPQDAAWSSPVVYSRRTDGTDGTSVNIVFKRAATIPSTPGNSSGIPSGWADGPPSGTDLLWASRGSKAAASVFIWTTAFQVEGAAHAEVYIYRKNSSGAPSGGSYNFTTNTLTVPSNWANAPQALTANGDSVYVSVGLANGASTATAASITWGTVALYATRTDGATGATGATGLQGIQGVEGDDGAGIEYIFAKTADTSTTPSAPNNAWGFDQPSSPWYDAAPSINTSNKALWRAQRAILGNPSVGATVSDTWSSSTIVGRFADDGVAGADGDDGTGIEYIFAVTSDSGTSPSAPNNNWGFDSPQSPWYDGAPSMTTSNKALWRAQRDIEGTPSVGATVSDSWSGSTVVGRFGEDGDTGATGLQGVAGVDGDDGAGIEYIFAKTSDSSTSPSAPNNNWGFDSPQSPWYDAAPSINTSNKALWRAQRAILGDPDVGDAVSANWSSSTVVGRFADDGVEGADGEDGAGIEYIFAVTSDSDTSPSAPNNNWGFDQPSSPWYDAAPAMTASNKALWRAQRAILGNPSVGATVSANWSGSTVVGRFGEDGQTGQTGQTGPDGDPLRNAQVYFFHNAYQSSAPTAPATSEVAYNFSNQTPSITTSGWSANLSPPALSSDDTGNNKLHAVKVVFQETTYNGAYTETISNVFTWTAFDGLVTFTNLNNATNENGVASATLIDGGGIIAGSIEVDRLSAGSATIATGREFHLGSGAAIGSHDVVFFGKGTTGDMSGVAGIGGTSGIGVGGASRGTGSAGGWFGNALTSNYATTGWNTYCEMATPSNSAVFMGTVDILNNSNDNTLTNFNLGTATNTGDHCINIKEGIGGSRVSNQISIYADGVTGGDTKATLALILDRGVESIGTFTPSHKLKIRINGIEYWLQLDQV